MATDVGGMQPPERFLTGRAAGFSDNEDIRPLKLLKKDCELFDLLVFWLLF